MLRRLLMTGALAAVPVLGTLSATPALAGGPGIPAECGISETCTVIYYYDAAHTETAGSLALNCNGVVIVFGDPDTPYYTVRVKTACPPGGGRAP